MRQIFSFAGHIKSLRGPLLSRGPCIVFAWLKWMWFWLALVVFPVVICLICTLAKRSKEWSLIIHYFLKVCVMHIIFKEMIVASYSISKGMMFFKRVPHNACIHNWMLQACTQQLDDEAFDHEPNEPSYTVLPA